MSLERKPPSALSGKNDNQKKAVHPIVKLYRIARTVSLPMLGLGLAIIFYEQTNYWVLGALFVYCLVWPHIAYFVAARAESSKKAEYKNMLFDAFVCGIWINLVSVSLVPTFTMIACIGGMMVMNGGYRFLLRGLAIMLFGYLISGLFAGYQLELNTSIPITLAFGTGLMLYVMMIGFIGYRQTGVLIRLKKDVRLQKERMEGLAAKLAKYLSPQVYGSIFSGEKDVKVETYRKKLTVFFSDIEGFTALTESMESEELTSLLNTYLNEMSNIAIKHGGTIDKYIGDSIMIFFGDPKTKGVKEDAVACVAMAMEMKECMDELRKKWSRQGILKPLRIRIGINTGYCTVGNFGSEDRLDYTIIGNQVNLASRLETNAEIDEILISHETYMLVNDIIECGKKELIDVKGVAQPIQTYRVIDFVKKQEERNDVIREGFEGFSLDVDLSKTDVEAVVKSLKNVLAKLK